MDGLVYIFLEIHRNRECSAEESTCEYCYNTYKCRWAQHIALCEAEGELCLRGCGIAFKAKDCEVHFQECPLEAVTCPISFAPNIKCKHVCRRVDLDTHMNDPKAIEEHEALQKLWNDKQHSHVSEEGIVVDQFKKSDSW